MKHIIGNTGYFVFKEYMKYSHKCPKILNAEETVNYIIKHKCSIARYGDGEFLWIFQARQQGNFEKNSPQLAKKLKEVLITPHPNLLIGLPDIFNNLNGINIDAKTYWEGLLIKHGVNILKLLDNETYGDASFTRPYMDYSNQKIDFDSIFNRIKDIWRGRNVLIVEGIQSRFGVGNDLLKNTQSVKRIVCPSINAFESYEKIKNITINKTQNIENVLVLVVLGPTATVLAADLSSIGIQAIDIGHLDVEYEWFKLGAKSKVPIRGKYVNESKNKFVEEFSQKILDDYKLEIIGRVE